RDSGTAKLKSQEGEAPAQSRDAEAFEAEPVLKTFNAQKFIEEVTKKAEELIQKAKDKVPCFSNKSNGPCLSGIYDLTTVKTFYGQNFF
uniref:hypothetical protein n=1 Tax=uncultured Apibacter sp. TaxID=1778616 RepID=UPI0025D3E4A2